MNKTKQLTAAISERLGHTRFRVWYEPVRGPCFEMQGYAGGWFVEGDDIGITPLGHNSREAMENIKLFFKHKDIP